MKSSKLHSPSGGARQSLGIVDQLPQQCGRLLRLVLGDNLGEASFRNVAGGELGAQVAEDLHRKAHVALYEGHDGLVDPAGLVELHWGDAQTLRINFGRIRCIRSCDAAADVGVVTDRAGEGEPLAPLKQRLEDKNVRQMHATIEWIVHYEHVARRDIVAE